MSLWLDFVGAEIRFINTKSFGRVRIAEAGRGKGEALIFLHGVGGHLEAYAKNVVALSDEFHTIALDFVGHGLSEKRLPGGFSPLVLAHQVAEVMDVLGIEKAHLSGESLGGWTAGIFATTFPERTLRLMLNTAAGIPIVNEKGRQDLANLIALTKKNAQHVPTVESVRARMQWLMHEKNWHLLTDELIGTRLHYYLLPNEAKPAIGAFLFSGEEKGLIPLDKVLCDTLFLWTRDNPIHDLAAAESAMTKIARSSLYVMKADSAHWPQYEASEEFNAVTRRFFKTGEVLQ